MLYPALFGDAAATTLVSVPSAILLCIATPRPRVELRASCTKVHPLGAGMVMPLTGIRTDSSRRSREPTAISAGPSVPKAMEMSSLVLPTLLDDSASIVGPGTLHRDASE